MEKKLLLIFHFLCAVKYTGGGRTPGSKDQWQSLYVDICMYKVSTPISWTDMWKDRKILYEGDIPLGPDYSALFGLYIGVALYIRGGFVLKKHIWDITNCPY